MIIGPAAANVTDHIYDVSTKITEYLTVPELKVDLNNLQTKTFTVDGRQFTVEVIDSVNDYAEYMKELFDFGAIKDLIRGSGSHRSPFKVLFNALSGGNITAL